MSSAKKKIIVVSLIVLILALLFVMYQLFQVRSITVSGCETIAREDVIALSGISMNQSVLFLDKQRALNALDDYPYIKAIGINIGYPDRINIAIEERREAAYVPKEGVLLAIDKESYLLHVITDTSQPHYPIVFGLKMASFEVGQRLGVGDTFQLDALGRVIEQLSSSELQVNSIDMTWPANIVLQTADGFMVEIGDDTQLAEKFTLAVKAKEVILERGKSGGVLDVSAADSAYYLEK